MAHKPIPNTRKSVTLPDADWECIATVQEEWGLMTEAEAIRKVVRAGLYALSSEADS